jgi:hypothetical protein
MSRWSNLTQAIALENFGARFNCALKIDSERPLHAAARSSGIEGA